MNNHNLKYIWFTFDGCGLSVAKKLIDEGNTVIVAQLQDISELHNPKKKTEEKEDRVKRLSSYDGIIPKFTAADVLKRMAKIKNKDEWFVVCDINSLWYYGQEAVKLGFTNGFFPTEQDTLYEDDRERGKKLVKKYWPDLAVAEMQDFKRVEDAIAFLNDTNDLYVLKANAEGDFTVLPKGDDPKQAAAALIGALTTNKKDYEKAGFTLELKISNPIEITPEIAFYNGEPLFTTIDIENKPIGSGSIGNMTGCSGNLIFQTDMNADVNAIAFPDKVYEMAGKHPGLFIWDASMLIDGRTKKIYFGEFCPNRWGYDAFFTQIEMSGSASHYFESIVKGKSPLKQPYGVAVRLFNIKKFENNPVILNDETGVFLYDVMKKDDQIVTIGADWSLLVATGAAGSISEAVDKAYSRLNPDTFTDGYYRPKFDFVSDEYQNSIPNRYAFTNHWLFDCDDWTDTADTLKDLSNRIGKAAKSHSQTVSRIKAKSKTALDTLKSSSEQDLADLRAEMESILDS